ncbi:MAG: hypothetical protein KOO62_09900 [candidate division Zixibacteria bacterium]|nr:hypothetical protein [candidate division Zixibacteria bacterium]
MFSKNHISWVTFSMVSLVLIVALMMGCDSKSVRDDTTGGGSGDFQITLTATPTQVDLNSSIIVEALVQDGGVAQTDQEVSFQATPSSAGYFSLETPTTDDNGIAATVFIPSSTGSAVITANAEIGLATATNSVTISITTSGGGASTEVDNGNLGIDFSKSILLANGGDTSVVTIAVVDSNGVPAPDGSIIKLTAGDRFVDVDGDGYWSLCCDSLINDLDGDGNFDAVGTIPTAAIVSGGTGVATVNYISGIDSGQVYIRATIDAGDIHAFEERSIHLTPNIKAGFVGISVSRAEVLANGKDTTIITVAVCDAGGDPAPDGTPVTILAGEKFYDTDGDGLWSQCCDSLITDYNSNGAWDAIGTVAQTVLTSDGTGEATVVYYASSDSATVWIKATVDTNGIQGRADFPIQILPPGAGSIEAYLSRDLLLANGVDTTILTIQAWDGFGMPVAESTLVVVTAGELFVDVDSNGTFSTGVDSVLYDANNNGQWDAIGLVCQYNYFIGDNGVLHIPYVSGHVPTTIYLKVTLVDPKIRVATQVPVQLQADAIISSIYMKSDSINLVVKHCGGIEIANLYATGYDIHGNPVSEGVEMEFLITNGPGGGECLDTVGYGPYVAKTNSQGTATVSVHSGTISGTIRLRAKANDSILSNATHVMISAGPPKYIAVGAEFCNVDYLYSVGYAIAVTAVVSDTFHNPVNDSTVVYFTADEGTMQSHEKRTENLQGIATTWWFSGYDPDAFPVPDGIVVITAETAGGTVSSSATFYNTGSLTSFTVTGFPDSMLADGLSEANVVVYGWDINNNPVVDGTLFKGDANFLLAAGGALYYACGGSTSSCRIQLQSQILLADWSTPGGNDDGVGAIDVVQFWKGAAGWNDMVVLKTGEAYSGNSSIGGNFSVNVGETAYLNVTVKDRWTNPLGDHTLVATYPGTGVAGPGTKETNLYGEAFGFSWTPADTGTFQIVITDTDPRGGIVWSQAITVGQ